MTSVELSDVSSRVLELKNELKIIKNELAEIKKTTHDNSSLRLKKNIVQGLEQYLYDNYRGSFVAITYDGKVIESAIDRYELHVKLDGNPTPREQLFIYEVPLKL